MKEIWDSIELWFKSNASDINLRLLPGAKEEEIQEVETFLNVRLPNDFRMSLKIHNGQHGLATPMIGEWQLYSLDDLKRRWSVLRKLFDQGTFSDADVLTMGPIVAKWWDPGWIPIAHNGAGDLHCIDTIPAPGGQIGQIISFWHMDENRAVLADSFTCWLKSFADDLKKGAYEVTNDSLVFMSSQ